MSYRDLHTSRVHPTPCAPAFDSSLQHDARSSGELNTFQRTPPSNRRMCVATAYILSQFFFINCPGEGCNERIPSVLISTGLNVPWHADLRYRVCSNCRYFKWLDPELFEAAERRAQDALQMVLLLPAAAASV
ncbi:hypothetical protein B0H13DRAFT_2342408 [Mycena leptocephala]|nr:hypothetical protein B0H13DRAFT_2342408 [Mycena leptocephala]